MTLASHVTLLVSKTVLECLFSMGKCLAPSKKTSNYQSPQSDRLFPRHSGSCTSCLHLTLPRPSSPAPNSPSHLSHLESSTVLIFLCLSHSSAFPKLQLKPPFLQEASQIATSYPFPEPHRSWGRFHSGPGQSPQTSTISISLLLSPGSHFSSPVQVRGRGLQSLTGCAFYTPTCSRSL